jgi:hypothetical protein
MLPKANNQLTIPTKDYSVFLGIFVPEWESEFTTSWGVVLCSMIHMENHDSLL